MSGRLGDWSVQRATANGLHDVAMGDLVAISQHRALVTALHATHVELAPLSTTPLRLGALVTRLGPVRVPCGDALIGRTIDALGEPLDGGPRVDATAPLWQRAPSAARPPAGRRLTLGLLAHDLQTFTGAGASLVGIGDAKLLVAQHVLRHQHHAGRVCIVASPAPGTPALADVEARYASRLGGAPSVVPHLRVATPRDGSPMHAWLVPWTALAIASAFRAAGREAFVVIDTLDAWPCEAAPWRGTRATQLAQLTSIPYVLPSGSVTLLALARTITYAMGDAFDRVLDLGGAFRGEPLVLATSLVRPPLKVPRPAALARALGAVRVLRQHELHAPWAHDADHDLGRRVRECLRVRPGMPVDSAEQLACLFAVVEREVPPAGIAAFVDAYVGRLRGEHAERLAAIRAAGRFSDDDLRALVDAH